MLRIRRSDRAHARDSLSSAPSMPKPPTRRPRSEPGRRPPSMVAEGAQLIDVRQDYEWDAGHIEGAVHIPLEQLPAAAERLDRERADRLQLPQRQPLGASPPRPFARRASRPSTSPAGSSPGSRRAARSSPPTARSPDRARTRPEGGPMEGRPPDRTPRRPRGSSPACPSASAAADRRARRAPAEPPDRAERGSAGRRSHRRLGTRTRIRPAPGLARPASAAPARDGAGGTSAGQARRRRGSTTARVGRPARPRARHPHLL